MQVLVIRQNGLCSARVRELCLFRLIQLISSPVGGVVKGTGVGASKADARQAAAQEALTVSDKGSNFATRMLTILKALRSPQ